ncbi:hypothetical protein ACEN2J_10285 [Pseudorhodobacter sp. W20_MBD10_FR17]|uniref:hypothetical protein n=1 Tax=Pseudorhodobacter sp. W20_MBD10_FR17 TaxID=3240266 RepID=UPI003F965C7B
MLTLSRVMIVVIAWVGLCLPMAAKADANWDAAKTALSICAKTYPDGSKAKDALKAAGWRYHGIQAGMHLYTQNGFRAVAATNAGKSSSPRCIVSAAKMPVDFALEIGKPYLAKLNGAKEVGSNAGFRRWEGQFNGVDTAFGVFNVLNFDVMQGAAVGFVGQ